MLVLHNDAQSVDGNEQQPAANKPTNNQHTMDSTMNEIQENLKKIYSQKSRDFDKQEDLSDYLLELSNKTIVFGCDFIKEINMTRKPEKSIDSISYF